VRFGAVGGRLQAGRTLSGRGVYTCRRLSCFERAGTKRAFNRVLHTSVRFDSSLADLYTER
jgi:predicted RNA-binding protein YlxR (DUF448 family)